MNFSTVFSTWPWCACTQHTSLEEQAHKEVIARGDRMMQRRVLLDVACVDICSLLNDLLCCLSMAVGRCTQQLFAQDLTARPPLFRLGHDRGQVIKTAIKLHPALGEPHPHLVHNLHPHGNRLNDPSLGLRLCRVTGPFFFRHTSLPHRRPGTPINKGLFHERCDQISIC